MKRTVALCLFALAGMAIPMTAEAGVRIGIGIGGPAFYGYGPRPYYRGYPYYYGPTYIAPPPVVYQIAPAPIIVRTAPPTSEPVPAPPPAPVSSNINVEPAALNIATIPSIGKAQNDPQLRRLADASETARRDAALDLGRAKAQHAVDALITMLSKDSSPIARDGAARALGLIAAPRSLNALIYAAQADDDREVRHSAQFAVEVIRNQLRGQ